MALAASVAAPPATAAELFKRGMRVQLKSANLITGQHAVSLDIDPDAPPAENKAKLTRRACTVATLLALVGCAGGEVGLPQVGFETELGQVRTNTQGAGSNPATANLSGYYTGTGTVARNPGGTCAITQPVTNFYVRGDRVSYGQFSGTIRANGSLQMVSGQTWVVGQFNGPHFDGRYIAAVCSYQIAMNRTG